MEKLYNITQKPIIKALISIIVPLVFGIISGIYVNSITVDGEVKILLSYKHLSFYILLFLIILELIYYSGIYKYEKSNSFFGDDAYCEAYMRSQLIPALAEKYKNDIQNGNITEFAKTMSDFRKGLKKWKFI